MCVVCWQEFDDCLNPPVDLGCGHYGCGTCRDAIHACPVCQMAVATTLESEKCEALQTTAFKPWSTPRRRHRCGEEEELGDLLDDDHLAPTVLGSADEATAPRVRMLERAPSSAAGSVPSRSSHSVALSARHLAHGGFTAGRMVLSHALVPAVKASFFVSKTLLTTTCRAAAGTGRALAHVACSFVRFTTAPRRAIIGFDGSLPEPVPFPDGLDPDPSEADSAQLSRAHPHGSHHHNHHHRNGKARHQQYKGPCPEPISNIVGGRITLRDCRNTRLRVEYCRDCVVVASGLESVELLMVCCQRVKLVMRNCNSLVLRELQCTAMADFVRRGCPNFVHEIVCLRCACKPFNSGGGGCGGGH